ncbi:MAG: TadE/TadG family type IV pilus assembly protein [Maioricimonas sp. JB049]
MTRKSPLRRLLQRVHRNEDGAVSLETILIIGAIAIPILIFLLRWGWPRIRDYFNEGMDQLEEQSDSVIDNN